MTLRQARVQQGQTLEEIGAATRITLKNLTAIESDDLAKISSPFIYRSFVRQYAEALKLDYASMAADVRESSHRIPEPLMPGQDTPLPVRNAPIIQPHVRRDFRWMYPVGALILVVAACSSLYGVWRHEPVEKQRVVAATVLAAARTQTAPAAPQAPAAQPTAVTQPAKPSEPTTVAAKTDSPIHLELAATESSWVSVTCDGKTAYSGLLEAAATKILDSHDKTRIRLGNAGGVNVTFNGKVLGALGKRGQVRTVEFTPEGYRDILVPTSPAAETASGTLNPSGE